MAMWFSRVAVAVSACVLMPIAVLGQESTPRANTTPHLVLAQTEHDFGNLDRSAGTRTTRLTLRNTGSRAIDIRKVRTSCLCLTADPSGAAVAPGGEATLLLTVDPRRVAEIFTEEVMIYSSDPVAPLLKFRVSGNTSTPVRIEPLAIPLGISYRGDLARIAFPSVRVIAADGAPFGSVRTVSSHPAIRPESRKLADGSYEVTITVDKTIELGQIQETVKVETAHPRMPIVEIPVLGAIVGDLTPVGRLVDFGFIRENEPATATLRLPKRGEGDIKIVGAQAKLPVHADVEARTTAEGTHVEIVVRIPSAPAFTMLTGHIELQTNIADEPLVRVQVAGAVFARNPFDEGVTAENQDRFRTMAMAALARGEHFPADRFFADILGGVTDQRAVKVLFHALTNGSLPTRMRAVELLAAFRSAEVTERLRRVITEDSEEFVRRNAVIAYAETVGGAAVPELLLALQDDFGWVREDAALYLGKLGDARVIPALRAALSDPDPDANIAVRDALAAVQARVR